MKKDCDYYEKRLRNAQKKQIIDMLSALKDYCVSGDWKEKHEQWGKAAWEMFGIVMADSSEGLPEKAINDSEFMAGLAIFNKNLRESAGFFVEYCIRFSEHDHASFEAAVDFVCSRILGDMEEVE